MIANWNVQRSLEEGRSRDKAVAKAAADADVVRQSQTQALEQLQEVKEEAAQNPDMLQLAVSGYPEFVVDRRELKRKGLSYTVDTLAEFKAELPDAELYFLMGADSLRDLLTWRDPDRITQLATLVACNRPGLPNLDLDQVAAWVGPELAGRIRTIQIPGTDISASELRDRIQSGRNIRFLTPRSVEAFVIEHKLYR